MVRAATRRERARILEAIPDAAWDPRYAGGAASVLLDDGRTVLDGVARLDDTRKAWVRPLTPSDPVSLDACLSLLERRRAQVVHDTSGPLMGVMVAIETVLEYEPVPGSTRTLLEDSRDGLLRLKRIIAERASSGHPSNAVSGPLSSLLRRLVQGTVEALVPEGRLHVEIDAGADEVRLDASMLELVVSTLLSNAWAWRQGQEASVRVEAELSGGLLRVSLEDDGRGLDDEELLRAGELGWAHRPNGVGLGLFQLRRAIHARDGALVIHRRERGLCATVFVRMNAAPSGD